MSDKRPLILARLAVVVSEVDGMTAVARNVLTLPPVERLPAGIVNDGDELANEDDPHGRVPSMTPRIIRMRPQVIVAVEAEPENLSAELNSICRNVILDVLADDELLALTINRAGIRYDGMETDLAMGRAMTGQASLMFTFTYRFNPQQDLSS